MTDTLAVPAVDPAAAETPSAAPRCAGCGVELLPRPLSHQTREQRWAGDWYDHPHVPTSPGNALGHTTSALDPSEAIRSLYPDLYGPPDDLGDPS